MPSESGVEVSCTAAITDDGKWIRLYPVPHKFLKPDKRFRKYQWIEVEVTKSSDARPESYRLDINTINILKEPLPTWDARKQIIFPLKAHSLCDLQRERDANKYPTLGFFRPKVIKQLRITETSPTWSEAQLEALKQDSLFEGQTKIEVEKVPFDFHYIFSCEDADCRGHALHCTDWEMGQAWRSWSKVYGADWQAPFRQRFEKEMIERNDTHFFVGTVHRHPSRWIIIGLYYPPKPKDTPLFG